MAKSIQKSSFTLAEYKRQVHLAAPDAGTAIEEVLQPVYWAHISGHVAVGDRIDVIPVDQSWYCDLLVTAKPATPGLRVALLTRTDLAGAAENVIEFAGHLIRHEGPLKKWSVTRKARGQKPELFIRDGFDTSEEARDHVKGLASGVAA